MEVISIEEQSFYELLDKLYERFEEKHGKQESEWVDEAEAMKILNIRSKSTLSSYRNQDLIRFSQQSRKLILYYKPSLLSFIESHANIPLSHAKKQSK